MRRFVKSQQEIDVSLKAVRKDVLPRVKKLCEKHSDQTIFLATYVVILDCLKESGVSRAELRQVGDLIYPESPPALRVVKR